MDKHAIWIIDNSHNWWTPGGDPVYICSNCGGGRHVFGIESMIDQPERCPECFAIMDNAQKIIKYGQ